jgi:hypothetical protein
MFSRVRVTCVWNRLVGIKETRWRGQQMTSLHWSGVSLVTGVSWPSLQSNSFFQSWRCRLRFPPKNRNYLPKFQKTVYFTFNLHPYVKSVFGVFPSRYKSELFLSTTFPVQCSYWSVRGTSSRGPFGTYTYTYTSLPTLRNSTLKMEATYASVTSATLPTLKSRMNIKS